MDHGTPVGEGALATGHDFSLDDVAWPAMPAHTGTSPSLMRSADPDTVVAVVVRALEHDGTGLGGSTTIREFEKRLHIADDIDDLYSCYPASAGPGTTTVPSHSSDVVSLRRNGAPLMVVRLRCDVDHWTRSDDVRITVAAPQAKVDHEKRSTVHAVESFAVRLLVSARAGERPSILALDADRVLRRGAPAPAMRSDAT